MEDTRNREGGYLTDGSSTRSKMMFWGFCFSCYMIPRSSCKFIVFTQLKKKFIMKVSLIRFYSWQLVKLCEKFIHTKTFLLVGNSTFYWSKRHIFLIISREGGWGLVLTHLNIGFNRRTLREWWCCDIKPWLRNVPSWVLTATVAVYKQIELVVEITITPHLEVPEVPRGTYRCYRVNKASPMKLRYAAVWPPAPWCISMVLLAQQCWLQQRASATIPSPPSCSQHWLKHWGGYIHADRRALLLA